MKNLKGALSGAATFLIAANSYAHLWLTDPPARHPADDLKYGPCGVGTPDSRTTNPDLISTYSPGETITVTWTETVDHDPSHYRIAFSEDGDTEFFDPTNYDDIRTGYPILLDGIADADAGGNHQYQVQVTLPNVQCDNCTLQVIQVMHDKPPWGPGGGDDIYYQCADIVLDGDLLVDPDEGTGGAENQTPASGGSAVQQPPDPMTDPPPPTDDSNDIESSTTDEADAANCSAYGRMSGPNSPTWWLGLLVALGVARRRARTLRFVE